MPKRGLMKAAHASGVAVGSATGINYGAATALQAGSYNTTSNLFSFVYGGISWGGHIGGLVGGILGTLAFARFGRGHAAYGRIGLVGVAGLVLIGAASVAIAYWKVKGYA